MSAADITITTTGTPMCVRFMFSDGFLVDVTGHHIDSRTNAHLAEVYGDKHGKIAGFTVTKQEMIRWSDQEPEAPTLEF